MAGECGYRSMLVAIGVSQGTDSDCEVISYEAPFGVGYLVAQLLSTAGTGAGKPPVSANRIQNPGDELGSRKTIPDLARRTIETFVTSGAVISAPSDLIERLRERAGCFVSIKTVDGDLRGCIGTIDPVKNTLAEEIIWNAISAATRDPRFSPVRADELPNLKYSVDILSAPEACTWNDLDPITFGVIVEDENGLRRGLLLPNLAGIDTVNKQVEHAAGKAGIARDTPLKLFRFRADRYSE